MGGQLCRGDFVVGYSVHLAVYIVTRGEDKNESGLSIEYHELELLKGTLRVLLSEMTRISQALNSLNFQLNANPIQSKSGDKKRRV